VAFHASKGLQAPSEPATNFHIKIIS